MVIQRGWGSPMTHYETLAALSRDVALALMAHQRADDEGDHIASAVHGAEWERLMAIEETTPAQSDEDARIKLERVVCFTDFVDSHEVARTISEVIRSAVAAGWQTSHLVALRALLPWCIRNDAAGYTSATAPLSAAIAWLARPKLA